MIITVDGPCASGKSTLAKWIARRLGFYYLNSGMLYRGLGYCLLHRMNINPEAFPAFQNFLPCLMQLKYCYDLTTGDMSVFLNNENITAYLKTSLIDGAASALGNNREARIAVMHFEHMLVKDYDNFSVDGRDCGSFAFPDAECKFYITADVTVRAKRWQHDQAQQGNDFTLEQAVALANQRDKNDTERDYAPLIIPEGAIVIDTSNLTLAQSEQSMYDAVVQKQKRKL